MALGPAKKLSQKRDNGFIVHCHNNTQGMRNIPRTLSLASLDMNTSFTVNNSGGVS
jgi:hypothetical protein